MKVTISQVFSVPKEAPNIGKSLIHNKGGEEANFKEESKPSYFSPALAADSVYYLSSPPHFCIALSMPKSFNLAFQFGQPARKE